MTATFQIVSTSAFSREALFDVSLSIDAHRQSMAATHEEAVAGVTSGRIGVGETVTWRARHLGVWFRLTTIIAEASRPDYFIDNQLVGPFGSFWHHHRAEAVPGGTRMTDTVRVASPLAQGTWVGAAVERAVLVPLLRRLLRQRNRFLYRALSG